MAEIASGLCLRNLNGVSFCRFALCFATQLFHISFTVFVKRGLVEVFFGLIEGNESLEAALWDL